MKENLRRLVERVITHILDANSHAFVFQILTEIEMLMHMPFCVYVCDVFYFGYMKCKVWY